MNQFFEEREKSAFSNLQKVYKDMTDEQSKEIYINRVLFSVTGEMQYLSLIHI